jgi:hypothetical protein
MELEKPATLEDAMALAHTNEQHLAMAKDILARSSSAKPSSFHTLVKPLALIGPSSTPAAPTPEAAVGGRDGGKSQEGRAFQLH